MEKFFEAVSHKNTRPLNFSYRETLSRGKTKQNKTKQTNKQTNPKILKPVIIANICMLVSV